MEYQDYHYQILESFEKKIERVHEELESAQRTLEEAGLPGYERVFDPDSFGNHYALCAENGNEESKAWDKKALAERELELVEKRLKAARSDDLGETVERAAWIRLAEEEVESVQMRLDKLQVLADIAKRDLKPFDDWWKAKLREWGRKRLKTGDDGGREEVESAEFKEQMEKHKEYGRKAHEASVQSFSAKRDLEWAERGLKAAYSDDFGDTIERATLVRLVQKEVESAQTRLDEAQKSEREVKLRGDVLGGLCQVVNIRRKIRRQKILVEWIERQRRMIVSKGTNSIQDTENRGDQDQAKRGRSRPLRNHAASATSRPCGSLKAGGRERKQRKTRSILSPVDPSRVSKAPEKKRTGRRKASIANDTSQSAEKTIIDPSTAEPRSKRISKVKDTMPAPLRSIHSPRVSKSDGRRSTELHVDGTKLRPTLARILLDKNASPALTETSKISKPTTGLRRSARIEAREPQLKGTEISPRIMKATDAPDPEVVRAQPLKEPKQQKKRSLTKTTTRKKGRPTGEYSPMSSKPQGVTKRRGHPRSRRMNA